MFQSSGFFKNVSCPFYKHDLCHRPYCHFKHVKVRQEKGKEKEKEKEVTESIGESDVNKMQEVRPRSSSPIDGVNDDILKIVKNISPTKLIEYAKRKQEVQELQQQLEQVDKESKDPQPSSLPVPSDNLTATEVETSATTVRSAEEIKRGLVDSFYSKAKVDVNITSGDIANKPRTSNQVNQEKSPRKERRVCNCDDPDCSGFLEENEDNVYAHINIDQIEDEYMRRKMQRRLDRRKKGGKGSTNEKTSEIVIREADFFIPPVQQNPEPEQMNGVDEDLNNYIDKVKEEYEMKKKLAAEKKKLSNETVKSNLPVEKRVETVVEKEKTSSIEKEKSQDNVENQPEEKKKKLSSGDSQISNKKVLTDVDFFSTKVPQCNTDASPIDGVEDLNEDNSSGTKKPKNTDSMTNNNTDIDSGSNVSKKKAVNSSSSSENSKSSENKVSVKKKRIFIPNEVLEKTKPADKQGKLESSSSEKKIKLSTSCKSDDENETSGGISNKKKTVDVAKPNGDVEGKCDKKKNDGNKVNEGKSVKKMETTSSKVDNEKGVDSKSEKKTKTDQLAKQINNDRLEKNSSDKKEKGISSKSGNERLENSKCEKYIKSNSSSKPDTSNKPSCEKRKLSIDGSMLNEKKGISRTHTDSEGSNSSRNAFDIIMVSSSDDENDVNPEKGYSSYDDDNDPGNVEYEQPRKMKDQNTSSCDKNVAARSSLSGEPKKRVSLTSEEIHRKPVQPHKSKSLKMSYVSPSLKSSEELTKSTPKCTATDSKPEDYSFGTGKKRISHVRPTPATEKTDADRPRLEVDIGGKIPHLLRQKYFDKIIDEFIPKVPSKKEAFGKAFTEEADAYKRSNRKQIYINLCANIVKRIRAMPDYVRPKEQPKADPMKTGQPTTKSVKSDLSKPAKADLMKSSKSDSTKSMKVDLLGANKKSKVDIQKTAVSVSRIQSVTTAGYQKIDPKTTIPKNSIKPASSELVKTAAEHRTSGKRERTLSLTLEPMELTEDNFYEHMKQYLLTKEQLWDNKYPKRDPDNAKGTIIKDYNPSANTLKRECCRCGKEYLMNKKGKYVTRSECHYHWGKLLRQRGRNSNSMVYTCCGVDSGGGTCALCRLHVCNKIGPLANYVSTELCDNKDSRRKVFSLDCEMCYTTQGLELTRLTVIDFDLEQIIDLFVKPTNPIVDYNTRFSGVTREDLADVTTTINDIHDILLNMIDKDTILLGHSLESDLNALNIIHEKVVDTAIVFPHRMGLPLKRALRNLMVDYLQKVIQSGEGGHDSCEDARACMELMKYKFKEDQKSRKRLKPT